MDSLLHAAAVQGPVVCPSTVYARSGIVAGLSDKHCIYNNSQGTGGHRATLSGTAAVTVSQPFSWRNPQLWHPRRASPLVAAWVRQWCLVPVLILKIIS